MSNRAKEIITPKQKHILRAVFLYVGQGESTLLLVPDGEDYKYVLIDSHQDDSFGGLDILRLLKDLFDKEEKGLDIYVNTHPHKDHLGVIKKIHDEIGIKQVWHSGHKPGKDNKDAYEELEYVMKKIGDDNVFRLKGSKEENKLDDKEVKLGDINYNILAPAEYVVDDIEGEKPEERNRRIHEQCGVVRFKFGKKEKQILITGDADYDAWTKHITDYHKDRLPSTVLSAVHHGSNSFFWNGDSEKEDPYREHLDTINPSYVVVSAPKSSEGPHGHPDEKAMNLYKEKVGEDNLKHLGKKRECIIVDIKDDGDDNFELRIDDELVTEYGIANGKKDGQDEKVVPAAVVTKIDHKPMG